MFAKQELSQHKPYLLSVYVSVEKFQLSLALVKHKYASHRLNIFSVETVETLCFSNWNRETNMLDTYFMTGLSRKVVGASEKEALLTRVLT